VFNVLLQILEDGRLTDGKGRTVDFRNAVVIMTSNVGSSAIFELAAKDPKKAREEAMAALRELFRPEFLNRIDDIVMFSPLGKEQIERIIELQLASFMKRLAEKQVRLQLTAAADETRHPAPDSGPAGAQDSRRRSPAGRSGCSGCRFEDGRDEVRTPGSQGWRGPVARRKRTP